MTTTVFDCNIKNVRNPLQSLLKVLNVESEDYTKTETEICGQLYESTAALEEIDVIIRIVRKNWCYLQNSVLNGTAIPPRELADTRLIINKCFNLIVLSLQRCESDRLKQKYVAFFQNEIKTLLPLILPTSDVEKEIYLKLTGPSCNKDKCPIYHYFHTFQDVQYYVLLFYYLTRNSEEFRDHITCIMKDLIVLSESAFRQRSDTAFSCACNKDFWLIIQVLSEKLLGEDTFWLIFNKVVENCNSDFVLWLLHDVADLQAVDLNGKYVGAASDRIRPNFVLLESALKNVITNVEFGNSILPTLKSIEPLVCNLWLKSSKIEVYQMLWEYYSKRLNVSARANTNLPLPELTELIDTILWAPKDCTHDFELFLAMLSLHLNEHTYHWGKMKGRIYSQLGPNKLKDLNSGGIFNVLLLFLSLTKVNFDELSKKFLSFIENLPMEKKQSQLIWRFYTAFVVRHLRENRNIETVTVPFIKMLEESSTDHRLFHLIKNFVQDFDCIMNSTANLQLHQWLLLNSWIHKYMSSCYYPDMVTLLNVLLSIIERITKEDVWGDWEFCFKNYVYPALKYSRSTPETCGTLAAKIAILSPNLQAEAFVFFNSETVTPKVSANFLCTILENYPHSLIITPQQETMALQTWVKFCLLTRDGYEDLTRNIIKLDIIPQFIKTAIAPARDPLCAFLDCIGGDIKTHVQSSSLSKLCEIFFGQAERWTTQYFSQPDNEGIVLRIYTCLGLAFFKIGPLLYDKHKSNCPFARLVTSLLLPTELILGKPLNPFILQSIKKTWHLFFEATVKLNSPNDAFIDRILRELVIRYIPHFATVDSPMLKCLDNEFTAEVILDKLANAFFKQATKEAESNIFKSLKLINDFVQSTTSIVLLKLIVNKTLYGLLEVIMFHNQRNMAVSIVKNITSSPLYPQVKSEIEQVIVGITEKHLAFNTPNYFQLLGHLSRVIPTSLKSLIPRIKQQVVNVERMRGVGYDKNLRLNMERFEATLLKLS
ncbi:hypothetical protein Zmor_006779 [Zophobas morio]|uniref:Protein MMS22-like n=1 Tax=Zophobas morio TaxID=2755281 RepID=A0AA38J0L2_9CUCU|nr:hypothetical protein Zmor_006779 [Zophobas morio]